MNSKIIFRLSVFLLLICSWACQQETNPTPPLERPGPGLTDSLGSYQIDSADAVQYISDYQNYIDSVSDTLSNNYATQFPNPAEKLVYGARVDLMTLREILLNSDRLNPENDTLYLMMGTMENEADSTGLIFCLNSGADDSWLFFDFTMPCPNACPTLALED